MKFNLPKIKPNLFISRILNLKSKFFPQRKNIDIYFTKKDIKNFITVLNILIYIFFERTDRISYF